MDNPVVPRATAPAGAAAELGDRRGHVEEVAICPPRRFGKQTEEGEGGVKRFC